MKNALGSAKISLLSKIMTIFVLQSGIRAVFLCRNLSEASRSSATPESLPISSQFDVDRFTKGFGFSAKDKKL